MPDKPSPVDYARAKALIADLRAAGFIPAVILPEDSVKLWDIALKHTRPSSPASTGDET